MKPLRDDVAGVVRRIRAVVGGWSRQTTVAQMRLDWDALHATAPATAQREAADMGGVPCVWFTPFKQTLPGVVLYFHGGGYQLGSCDSHAGLMAQLATAAGCRVLGVHYRLAPEHLFPAPLQDALAVFDALMAQGLDARDVALAGDSAGAGLAVSLMLSLRDAGRALPVAAALMSPWIDMTASGESYTTRADADPLHQHNMILALARNCLGNGMAAGNPLASPLFADLRGLSPMLIHVGDRETVLSDAEGLTAKALACQVPAQLQVWPDMIHVFQLYGQHIAQANQSIQQLGGFLAGHLAPSDNNVRQRDGCTDTV